MFLPLADRSVPAHVDLVRPRSVHDAHVPRASPLRPLMDTLRGVLSA